MNEFVVNALRLERDIQSFYKAKADKIVEISEQRFERAKVLQEAIRLRAEADSFRKLASTLVPDSFDFYEADCDRANLLLEAAKMEAKTSEVDAKLEKLKKQLEDLTPGLAELERRKASAKSESESLVAKAIARDWPEAIADADVATFRTHYDASSDDVVLYDVLDHEDYPEQYLASLASERAGCRVLIRFHPWTSRHGGHCSLNLAFSHLILTEDELHAANADFCPPKHPYGDPMPLYRHWLRRYRILDENAIIDPLEDCFKSGQFRRRMESIGPCREHQLSYADFEIRF